MAASTISVEQEQFCCPVCLELLREPVTIPCGHSYCLDCIQDVWERPKRDQQYSCPQCRQLFNPRPLLSRNTVLGEVVDKLRRSRLPSARPAAAAASVAASASASSPPPGAVPCSVCTGRPSRALKSCLVCLRSYCVAHLRAHEDHFRGGAHKLIPAVERLPEWVCPQHGKLLRRYCADDRRCVCSQCVRERHWGHDTVPVAEERAAQQKSLLDATNKSSQKLQEMEKELRYSIRFVKHSTKAAVEESERIFSKLIRSIEKHGSQAKDLMRAEERAALRRAEEALEKVQEELAALGRARAEAEALADTDNHAYFLQRSKSLRIPAATAEMPNADELPYVLYRTTRQTLAELRDSLGEKLQQEFDRISNKELSLKENSNPSSFETPTAAEEVDAVHNTGVKSRDDLLQYYNNLTLDPNTANPYLSLSDDYRGAATHATPRPYPDHPHRFTSWAQVLCRAGMAGRCYWEVEWAGNDGVSIGVCYRGMSRSGGGLDSKLGHNARSWSLDCSPSYCTFRHDRESWSAAAACGRRIGVELDFRAGTLSFYSVSDALVLLHTVHTTFAQPVYPGFWVGLGSALKLRWMSVLRNEGFNG